MDDRLIDEYIAASLKDIVAEDAAVPAAAPVVQQNYNLEEGTGGLIVAVTSLRGLRSVPRATVSVFTGDIDNRNEIHRELTDESGRTTVIKLKTKNRELSEIQGASKIPYLTYNVSVTANGFKEQINMGLPIFDGVVSIQNVDLTSVSAAGDMEGPIIYDETQDYNL